MRISDWSSDVCSSDRGFDAEFGKQGCQECGSQRLLFIVVSIGREEIASRPAFLVLDHHEAGSVMAFRSEEHTSELQSLMRISYAVFCLKKKHTNSPSIINTLTNINKIHKCTTLIQREHPVY